jgi:hypothetical protein
MRWLSAGLIFVNLSTVCGLLLGIVGHGLNKWSALLALISGAAFAVAAYLGTFDPEKSNRRAGLSPASPGSTSEELSKRAQRRLQKDEPKSTPAPWRYGKIWLWLLGVCFLMFAVRSFCWLLYIDGSELRIQSPNNLGDLSLHLTLIRNFANGVALWPDNPIYVFSKLRYPAGIDLFNALLSLVHVDLLIGLVWVGLLASLAIFYGFYRWGGTFAVAGFLFNGGLAGFQFLKTFKFLDYQGAAADIAHKPIAWKSIALSMLVTQRGWLYAIPAGLVLLWHWREKFFNQSGVPGVGDPGQLGDGVKGEPAAVNTDGYRKGPLPWWVELSIYASMPLFHLHTFIALTIVLVVGLFFERATEIKFIVNLVRNEGVAGIARLISHPKMWPEIFRGAPIRRHAAAILIAAFIPATFFVWLTTDQFHAASVMKWHPGWAQDSTEFAAPFFRLGPKDFGSSTSFGLLLQKTWNGVIAPFFQFWLPNFGLWVPLALGLVGLCVWRIWKGNWRWGDRPPADIAFVVSAVVIFVFGYFVQTAPWDWDNLKLMIWAYFLVLPFLWKDLIAHWNLPVRALVCMALFGSGFISLFGGLSVGRPGFGIANRVELAAVGDAVQRLPVEARFAAYPTFNHPLLLEGRKLVLGYPGHLWSQGFADYTKPNNLLIQLMQGAENWREIARTLHVRYIFWGREEMAHYAASKRPWEATAPVIASGPWGAIYDLEPTADKPKG